MHNKKKASFVLIVIALAMVGCSNKPPTESELKDYLEASNHHFKTIADQLKWKDEIYNKINSNISKSEYEELISLVKEKQSMINDIDLKKIKKHYRYKDYPNPNKEKVEEYKKTQFEGDKIKTEKLKENIDMYEEMVMFLEDGILSNTEIELKSSLLTKINSNEKIITSIYVD